MTNLTLSINDDFLKQIRLYAMVRDYSEGLVTKSKDVEQAERLKDIAEMNRFLDEMASKAPVPDHYRWKREDAYKGRLPHWNKE
jgi:hypothetical protein